MSGHNKWSQIKRQKGVADKKKGQSFSKLAAQISLAARSGPAETNFKLRLILEQAKKVNMPGVSMQRAIDRGLGKIEGQKIEEVLYEIYGPYGVTFLVEAATDNRNRTTSQIKNILSKADGKLAEGGGVGYLYEKNGEIICKITLENKDDMELAAIDAGAKDIQVEGEILIVITNACDLQKVKQELEKNGAIIEEAKLSYQPKVSVFIDDAGKAQKILNLANALEEVDEVMGAFSNFDISENILKSLIN